MEGLGEKEKKTHGQGQQRGDCWEEGGPMGLNHNGKNGIRFKFKKQEIY